MTWPDLFYPVNLLARFAHNPGKAYWNVLKHVLEYIKGTLDYAIRYCAGATLDLVGYVDSDFAGCKGNWGTSITNGHLLFVMGALIL